MLKLYFIEVSMFKYTQTRDSHIYTYSYTFFSHQSYFILLTLAFLLFHSFWDLLDHMVITF